MMETLNPTKLFERYQDEGNIKVFINSNDLITHSSQDNVFTTARPLVIQRGQTTELNPEYTIIVKESQKVLTTKNNYYVITFNEEQKTFKTPTGDISYHPSSLRIIKNQEFINRLKSIEIERVEEFDEEITF